MSPDHIILNFYDALSFYLFLWDCNIICCHLSDIYKLHWDCSSHQEEKQWSEAVFLHLHMSTLCEGPPLLLLLATIFFHDKLTNSLQSNYIFYTISQFRVLRRMLYLRASGARTKHVMAFCCKTQVGWHEKILTELSWENNWKLGGSIKHILCWNWRTHFVSVIYLTCCVYLTIGKKAYTCQKCSVSRDEEEIKKMRSEILLFSDKASSFLSSGSILVYD